jgi:hypothetical protein
MTVADTKHKQKPGDSNSGWTGVRHGGDGWSAPFSGPTHLAPATDRQSCCRTSFVASVVAAYLGHSFIHFHSYSGSSRRLHTPAHSQETNESKSSRNFSQIWLRIV